MPGVAGNEQLGGLAAGMACKVLRFNPGQLCQGLIELKPSEERGGAEVRGTDGACDGGDVSLDVDLFPGFYIACFEKEA